MQGIPGLDKIDKSKLPKYTKPKGKHVNVSDRMRELIEKNSTSTITSTPKPSKTWWNRLQDYFGFKTPDVRLKELNSVIRAQNKELQSRTPFKLDSKKLKAWSTRVRKVGKCDVCSTTENLSAHHLWDKRSHPTLMYQDDNGVCLCIEHHNQFHKKYSGSTQVTPKQYERFKISIVFWENKCTLM